MFHEYPYSLYYSDIDKMCNACHKAGYHLEVKGDYLRLLDSKNNVVSNVKISFSERALMDSDGHAINSYIISGSTDADALVLERGDGTTIHLVIPFATKSEKDVLNKNITSYAYKIQVSGDKIQIVNGDSTVYEIICPFSIKAENDKNNKPIDTYACQLEVDGRELVLRDSLDRELSRLTVHFSETAEADINNEAFLHTYGSRIETGDTTVKLIAKDGNILSETVVKYSISSSKDTDGNAFLHDYAEKLVVDGDNKRIGVEAHDGTRLSTITVPFSTESTDAENAIETVQVIGDNIVFTTYGGVNYSIQAPYAIKCRMDDNSNIIKSTYVASVSNDEETGTISFLNAVGEVIATLTPTVLKANRDSYNNLIADYLKSIVVDNKSNYVIVTHGTGDTDSLIINYSNHAWKDSLNQPIQNTYVTDITFEYNEDQGRYEMILWNGDIPKAEIGRVVVVADRACADKNGRDLTTYIGNVEADGDHIDVVNGNDEIVNKISCSVSLNVSTKTANTVNAVNIPTAFSYNASEKALVITPGTSLTTESTLLVDDVTVNDVTFNNEEV